MSTPAPVEMPADIALAVRRQKGALRTLRAEGLILPLLLLALVLGSTGLEAGVGTGLALVLAFLPLPLVAAIMFRLDRFEPEPTRILVRTFLWGAGAATFVALIINTAVGLTLGDFASTVISAPVVEESAKALALLFVIRKRPGFLDGVHDGIVYAVWVALGFAMVENVLYYAEAFITEGWGGITLLFALRGVMTPFCHPIFTAMTGIGIGVAVARGWGRGGLAFGLLLGLAVAIVLHALWNLSAMTGATIAVYLVGYLPLAAIGIALLLGGSRRERRILTRGLAPEEAAGTLPAAEVALLTARGRARAQLRRRARRAGREARRMLHQYEAAAYELAHANAVGRRPGGPEPAAAAAAYRACLVEARTWLVRDAPGVLPAAAPTG
ncbi:MAG: PrsW family intramembrane metalloprotease [Actinomycetota bacterium]